MMFLTFGDQWSKTNFIISWNIAFPFWMTFNDICDKRGHLNHRVYYTHIKDIQEVSQNSLPECPYSWLLWLIGCLDVWLIGWFVGFLISVRYKNNTFLSMFLYMYAISFPYFLSPFCCIIAQKPLRNMVGVGVCSWVQALPRELLVPDICVGEAESLSSVGYMVVSPPASIGLFHTIVNILPCYGRPIACFCLLIHWLKDFLQLSPG